MQIISAPLGLLMKAVYDLTGNYGLAIILFTFLTKIILLPVSLWVHANGIKMVKLEPAVNRLKIRYFGDPDKVADEQAALYKQAHYSPFAGVIPVVVQVILLIGLVQIISHPETWLGGATLNTQFLGLDLSKTPMSAWGVYILVPLLAGLAALVLSLAQNRLNPLQASQGKAAQMSTAALTVGISLVLGFTVPAGVGLYWIASNLLTILQQVVLNKIRNPEKEIDKAELEASRKELADYTNTGKETKRSREETRREKADYKRFFSVGNKHIVFYSESSGFYKYFERIIAYLLENSKMTIHYVTSDPNDQIFDIAKDQPRIAPYYIGPKKLITLFMKVEADVMVMTMSDLGNYQYKRSYYSKTIRYVYVFHYPLSTHMVLHTGALRHYDTILCVGDFQFEEIRQTEKLFGDPEQELIACGYGQLEKLYDAYQEMPKTKREKPKVLIAPSWQPDNILDSCIDSLLAELLGKGFEVTVRPHPEYVKRYGERMDAIIRRYEDYTGGDLFFETDFTGNTSIFDSDTVISDWSGTAYEFVLVTEKPCVFIDTTPKINNPDYEKITVPPLEFSLRDQVGIRVKPDSLEGLAEQIRGIIGDESYAEKLREIRNKYIANFGHSGEVAGQYLIDEVKRQVAERKMHDA